MRKLKIRMQGKSQVRINKIVINIIHVFKVIKVLLACVLSLFATNSFAVAYNIVAPSVLPIDLVSGDTLHVFSTGNIIVGDPLRAVSFNQTVQGGIITVEIDAGVAPLGRVENLIGNAFVGNAPGVGVTNHTIIFTNRGVIASPNLQMSLNPLIGNLTINNSGTIQGGVGGSVLPATATTIFNINTGSIINTRLSKAAGAGTSTVNVNAANFTTGGQIDNHTTLRVTNGAIFTINDSVDTIQNFIVDSGGTVNVNAAAPPTSGTNFTNNGSFILPTAGAGGIHFSFDGTSTNNGVFDSNFTTVGNTIAANTFINNGQILHGLRVGAVFAAPPATLQFTNNSTGSITGTVIFDTQTVPVAGLFTINGGSINGTLSATPLGQPSTLVFNGNFSTQGNVQNFTTIQVNGSLVASHNITGFTSFTNSGLVTLFPGAYLAGNTLINNTTLTMNGGVIGTGSFVSNGVLTINAGNITAPISSTSSGSLININGNFTTQNTITGIGTINVNAGIFNINNAISNVSTLNVLGGIVSQNAAISGISNINVNSGTYIVNNTLSNFNSFINNSVVNMGGGTVVGDIVGGGSANSTININANTTTAGRFLNVKLINANSGTLTVNNAISGYNSFAINNGAIVLLNPTGSLTGNTGVPVTINSGGTLNLAGGSFTGNIVGNGSSNLIISNTYTNAGTISNVGNLYVTRGTFTVGNTISGVGNFVNSSTVNLNGPSVLGGIQGTGGASVLNINANYVTNSLSGANGSIGSIGSVSPMGTTNIASGVQLSLNNNIGSNLLNNNGTLALTTIQGLTGNYVQSSSGTFATTLRNSSLGNFGRLNVGGFSNLNGTVLVNLPDGGLQINNNDLFDIMITGGSLASSATIQAPQTSVLSFVRDTSAPANVYRLRAIRVPLVNATQNSSLVTMAEALDQIRLLNPTGELGDIIRILNTESSLARVESDLEQLFIPEATGGPVIAGTVPQTLILNRITERLNSYRLGVNPIMTGFNSGDISGTKAEIGPFFFGNHINQKRQDSINGFSALTGGAGIMLDGPITCDARLGAALSLSYSSVWGDHFPKYLTTIDSIQGTVFGSTDYDWLFADAMASLAANRYRTRHTLEFFNNRSATAEYTGIQTAGRVRLGIIIPLWTLEIAPLVIGQHIHLARKQYTERGLGTANQVVLGKKLSATTIMAGVRFMEVSEPQTFLPELHVLMIRDIKGFNLATTSQFTGAGPAFIVPSRNISKSGVNAGGSITVRFNDDVSVTTNYDLDARKNFTSHSLWVRALYLF